MFWVLSYFSENFLLTLGVAQWAGQSHVLRHSYQLVRKNTRLTIWNCALSGCTTWKNSTPGKCVRSRVFKLRILVTHARFQFFFVRHLNFSLKLTLKIWSKKILDKLKPNNNMIFFIGQRQNIFTGQIRPKLDLDPAYAFLG